MSKLAEALGEIWQSINEFVDDVMDVFGDEDGDG